MKIFSTGASGFLGKYLLKELAPMSSHIYVLSRKSDHEFLKGYSNVSVIRGDISNFEIIDNSVERKMLIEEVDLVVHAAALYDVQANHSDSYLQNVVGTQNVLKLVKKIKNIKAFYYVSTIAVGDDKSYFLEEDLLPPRKSFSDHYSETKYHWY